MDSKLSVPVLKDPLSAGISLLAAANLAAAALYPRLLYGPPGLASRAGYAAAASALIFLVHSRRPGAVFWDPLRSRIAGMACALWGLYLLLFGLGYTFWLLDIIFSILALLLWLGRGRPYFLLSAIGIFAAIGIRHAGPYPAMISLDLAMLGSALLSGGKLAETLSRRRPGGGAWSGRRPAAALAVFAALGLLVVRPVRLMVDPSARHRLLLAKSPGFPVAPPAELSPEAARLRAHVYALAGDIGERSAYQADEQDRARDYIVSRLREAGYEPRVLEYRGGRKNAAGRVRPYFNVEAVLPGTDPAAAEWVVSAHYDTAPGTPGADDNTSAVAILLETARRLRSAAPARGVRFVAFGTEEPPSFTTRDMGSYRYMRYLKESGARLRGLLNLEMLGYYNDAPGSQVFPPFLGFFHPDRGNFVSISSNLSSLGLMLDVEKVWRKATPLPVEGVFLPSVLSALFISDHLNFWFSGEKALMISDTAYFRNPYYHQAEDTPEKLDYGRMAEVEKAVAAVLTQL
ncbi:MAG: M28 family peptidase [Elusimicrobia bacterium]|nr:M28 family peptidase [Elusimicrobiota bacterium]